MGKRLDLWFDSFENTFDLLLTDRPNEPTANDDASHDFLFYFIRSLQTGEIVGFSNEGGNLATDYERLMSLLEDKPIPGLFDVPDLGLHDATLDEIITAIHRRFVLGEGTVEYPTAEKRERPLRVVAEEPADFEQEAGKDQH